MKIIGVDPGTARVGWGLIEESGGKISTLAYGCILTEQSDTLPERLVQVYSAFRNLLVKHKPDCVSVEDLFFSNNAKTAIAVGQARGVILLASAQRKLPVASYGPMTVKKTICGSGAAQKDQVTKMVVRLLKLKETPKPDDTADALAIAVTHAFSYKMKSLL